MPTPLFAKLNLTTQRSMVVVDAPDSFQSELASLSGVTVLDHLDPATPAEFVIAFVTRQVDVDRLSVDIAASAVGDAVVWFAYPKGTSKRFKADFNRDTGWNVIRGLGFDTVRQVAIDDDWSALRLRRAEFIGRR